MSSPSLAGHLISLVLILGIGCLLGGALIFLGWRGRRLDDHPVCRRCRFDLYGLVEGLSDRVLCPECGSERRPRIGNRKRGYGTVCVGGVLVALAVMGAGARGVLISDPKLLAAHKPMWLLRWEAKRAGDPSVQIALQEMVARVQAGGLDAALLDGLVADVAQHGPAGKTALQQNALGSEWDALGLELVLAGHGDPADRLAIAKSWVELSATVRPTVRVGQQVPCRIATKGWLPPGRSGNALYLNRKALTFRVGGHEPMRAGGSGGGALNQATRGSGRSMSSSTRGLQPGDHLPDGLGLGMHDLEIRLDVEMTVGHRGPAIVSWTQVFNQRFEYVPGDGDPITLLQDPDLILQLKQGVSVQDGRIALKRWGADVSVDFNNINAPVAFQVYLTRDEQRWPFGTINGQIRGSHGYSFSTQLKNLPDDLFDAGTVDLYFQADPDVARRHPDLTEIVDCSFAIEGLEVVDERPAP